MTNDELDKAIAEHLGWRLMKVSVSGLDDACWLPPGALQDASVFEHCEKMPPRYSADLNAMHEAVASLTELELSRYADEVCDLAYNGHHDADIQKILKMGAKELAECYVMAIGKWEGK